MRAQGSKYIAYPSVESIFQIKRNNIERFAYVGIPCQISGLERLAHERVDALAQKAAYKIGLFCMESFQPKPFKDIIMEKKGIDISKATKINTEKGRLYAWMPGEEKPITVKIKHFDEAMLPGCNVCVDFTAEEADISIGNLGAKDRNSVVIVRNEKGEKLFNLAVEKGYLIAESMNEKALEKIKALNRRKKIERARPQLFDELEPL
jgi:coenzyme F420 hydrogenase subunit beta